MSVHVGSPREQGRQLAVLRAEPAAGGFDSGHLRTDDGFSAAPRLRGHWTRVVTLRGWFSLRCSCGWESLEADRLIDVEKQCAVGELEAIGLQRRLAREARRSAGAV